MKKFFPFNLQKRSDSKQIDKSVDQIERDFDLINDEIKGLEKELNVWEKRQLKLESDLNEEKIYCETIEKKIGSNQTDINHLREDIENKTKLNANLIQTNRDLDQTIDSLDNNLKRNSDESNKEINELKASLEGYKKLYESKSNAYRELQEVLHPLKDQKLIQKRNKLNALREENQMIEKQINDFNDSKCSEPVLGLSPQQIDKYKDPIVAVIQLANLKLNSNAMEEWIRNELIRKEGLDLENNLTIEKTDPIFDETAEKLNAVKNLEGSDRNHSNTKSVSFKDLNKDSRFEPSFQQMSPQFSGQMADTSGGQQKPISALFGNTGEKSSPQSSAFGFAFGDQTNKINENRSAFGGDPMFSVFGNSSKSTETADQSIFGLFSVNSSSDQPKSPDQGFQLFKDSDNVSSNVSSPQNLFNFFK